MAGPLQPSFVQQTSLPLSREDVAQILIDFSYSSYNAPASTEVQMGFLRTLLPSMCSTSDPCNRIAHPSWPLYTSLASHVPQPIEEFLVRNSYSTKAILYLIENGASSKPQAQFATAAIDARVQERVMEHTKVEMKKDRQREIEREKVGWWANWCARYVDWEFWDSVGREIKRRKDGSQTEEEGGRANGQKSDEENDNDVESWASFSCIGRGGIGRSPHPIRQAENSASASSLFGETETSSSTTSAEETSFPKVPLREPSLKSALEVARDYSTANCPEAQDLTSKKLKYGHPLR